MEISLPSEGVLFPNDVQKVIPSRVDLTFSDSETDSDGKDTKRHRKHVSLFPSPDSDDEEDDMDEDFWQTPKVIYEPCKIEGIDIAVPLELLKLDNLNSVLNMDTWHNKLTDKERNMLKEFLPKDADPEKILPALFSGTNFNFGNPLTTLQNNLKRGIYHEKVAIAHEECLIIQEIQHKHFIKKYMNEFISKCIRAKAKIGVVQPEDKEYLKQIEMERKKKRRRRKEPEIQTITTVDPGLAETESDESSAEEEKQIVIEEPETKATSNGNTSAASSTSASSTTKKKSSYKPRGQRQLDPNLPNIPAFFVFTTLRDLLCNYKDKSADFDEILQKIRKDSQIMGQVLPQYDVVRFLDLALKFLRSPPASTTPPAGKPNADALVQYDSSTMPPSWKWIGTAPRASDENLQSLEQLFFFAISRSNTEDFSPIKANLSRAQKCVLTIQPTPPDLVDMFRAQETERFKNPERPYTYNFGGVKAIVAPMKRVAANSNRAREHYLLKQDRPSHVTLLCLVRDSASRLPGGVGTRADVALLLRDSKYIVSDVTEQKMNTVVSGALDRLHSEEDPCVKYDSDQKLWIYLHRNRKADDFYNLASQPSAPVKREQKKPEPKKLPTSPNIPAPRGTVSIVSSSTVTAMPPPM